MDVRREFRFEAAHRLPAVDPAHKCARLHGHSYRLVVTVTGDVTPETGMVIDFAEIAEAVGPLVKEFLDHRYLNDVGGLENPTSENVAKWVWERVAERLPGLSAVEVAETCTSAVVYRGD
jgi:6-pyruvoyltetrahydropterin/6-carboxytetrahydropterin synthase